jgi:hypothetical protein
MTYTVAELRAVPEAELIARHDAQAVNTNAGVAYYLDELARRDAMVLSEAIKQNTDQVAVEIKMLYELTHAAGKRMERLTWFIAALTALSVAGAVAALVAA